MGTMEESRSFFTSFKVLAILAFTIFRAQNTGLETFTVFLEAPRFLALTSFVVLSHDLNSPRIPIIL